MVHMLDNSKKLGKDKILVLGWGWAVFLWDLYQNVLDKWEWEALKGRLVEAKEPFLDFLKKNKQ